MEENGIGYEYQKKFDWLGRQSLDFYIPSKNIAIECQGEQHYKPKDFFGGESGLIEIKERDSKKLKLCNEHGVKVLYYTPYEDNATDIYSDAQAIVQLLND